MDERVIDIDKVVSEKLYTKKDVKRISLFSCLCISVILLFVFCIILFFIFDSVLGVYDDNELNSKVLKYLNVVQLYQDNYISDFDLEKAVDYSIMGLVASVDDKYGGYVPVGKEVTTSQVLTGNYYGVGISFNFQDTYLEISDIVRDSPAGRSGLKIGDKITKINGDAVSIDVYNQFVTMINKKEINIVDFEINNIDIITIELGEVKEDKVEYYVEDGVGYISIYTFVQDTVNEYKDAIDFFVESNVSEIIFDLRGNGGGDVDVVTEMLDYILGDCLLVDIQYSNGEDIQFFSDEFSAIDKDISIKILIDSASASASELFVMVLQDNLDAKLIGQTSYGKSTVLKFFTFRDGSLLSMSVGKYFSESKRDIEGVGINPDIILSDSEIVLTMQELERLNLLK